MILQPTLLAVVLLGAAVGGGVALLVTAIVGTPPDARVATGESSLLQWARSMGRRLPFAIGAALLVLLVTRWVVAAAACGALVLMWDRLFGGGRAEAAGIAKIEGLAAWT